MSCWGGGMPSFVFCYLVGVFIYVAFQKNKNKIKNRMKFVIPKIWL
jgi:hypothetical protein